MLPKDAAADLDVSPTKKGTKMHEIQISDQAFDGSSLVEFALKITVDECEVIEYEIFHNGQSVFYRNEDDLEKMVQLAD